MNKTAVAAAAALKSAVPVLVTREKDAGDPIDELPLPYIEMDREGTITRVNRATRALHPAELGELVGKKAWAFLTTDEKDPSVAAYAKLMQSGGEPPTEDRSLYDRTGEFRTYRMHRSLMRDGAGKPSGMRMVFVDTTEQQRALDGGRRRRLWLESVLESLPDAAIVTDALGIILSINPAAESLLGWNAGELTGKLIEEALPMRAHRSAGRPNPAFTLALKSHQTGKAVVLDREGRKLRIEISASPVIEKGSASIIGVVCILRKVTRKG